MTDASLVPGPRSTPVLGAIPSLLRFVADPLGYVGRLFAEYGPVAALVRGKPTRLVSTSSDVPGTVFVFGPELNRPLFSDHERFHKCALSGPLYPQVPSARTRPLTRMLTGLFHVNGDEHRQHRRLLMPAFHRRRVESYRDDMVAITESVIENYRSGETRDVRPDMMEITLRVATKTLFGADMGDAGISIARDLQRWLELYRPAAIFPFDIPGSPYRAWLDVSHSVDARMAELISERRQSGALGNDMLSSLMDASDEAGGKLSADELIGHAGVIFAAGHETSSNALCWTLFLLSQHPKVAADLADELAGELRGDAPTVEQLARLPLLDHVVKESLRVFPPVPFNHRLAAGDTELGGYTLRSGTEIISSIYHTHRIEEIYPDAQRFKPERWEQLDPGPYAYSPFSAGPRMCIGAAFAMMEIKVVLAVLLQRFRFEIVPGSRVDRFMSITMAPKHGLPMVVHRQDNRFERRAPEVRGNVREMVTLGA